MQENRLLLPVKREEVTRVILSNCFKVSDFNWETQKSEELLEKSKKSFRGPISRSLLIEREMNKDNYENYPQPLITKLIHKETGAFFTFDYFENKMMSKYSLGKDFGTNKKEFRSLEEQINFAKQWLSIDLVEHLQAEGLIIKGELNQELNFEAMEHISQKTSDKEELTDIEKADYLYQEIVIKHSLTEDFQKSREAETAILWDIEKIDDAIGLYGSECPKKKLS
ncbi:MAG TPA: hypothetical protein PKY59_16730 [Pyrinomonadaceae bacterium]|nr:hypothetical protein [Pyrinomonadaceae bacterium]